MRIGIDARMMGKGYGIGRYIEELVDGLLKLDSQNEYVLFVRPGVVERARFSGSRFSIVETSIPWYSWQEQVFFSKLINHARVDLMHFPHWNVPLLYRGRFVVTIHDLTMYHYPRPEATTLGPVTYWVKDHIHRMVVRHAVEAAQHIFVTSEFTKQDVCETLAVPEEKMTVTYQAAFERKKSMVTSTSTKPTKPYILYVGAAYPHKNIENLIRAWKIFTEKYDTEHELVLVGKNDSFWDRLVSTFDITHLPQCRYLGFVPDDELGQLYAHASVFVFPSLYEGFGLPPLEAMVSGLQVVSTDRSCLKEVLGDGAAYIDPENPEDIARTLYRVASDAPLREELIQKGRNQARNYSWDRLVQHTLDAYMRIG